MTTEANGKDNQPTFPCQICGRHFIKSSLEKHVPACKKLTKMQRKVFDSGKQRAAGSDIPLKDVRRAAKEREKIGGVFPRPQTHWRERHEEFIGAVSASKHVGKALKTGAPLPPPPRTAGNTSDYVRCDHCGRTFNKNAAERHIAFCKEQSAQKAIKDQHQQQRQRTSSKNRTDGAGAGVSSQMRQKTASSTGSSTVSTSTKVISSRNGSMGGGGGEAKVPSTSSSRGSRAESVGARRRSSAASGGGMAKFAAGGGGAAKVPQTPAASKLPQPNKRSNSAPKHGGVQNGVSRGTAKSNFATPKSAGSTKGGSSKSRGGQPK